jgi:Flp pilus assembly protein TadD
MARLLVDSGLAVIVALVSPAAADRELARRASSAPSASSRSGARRRSRSARRATRRACSHDAAARQGAQDKSRAAFETAVGEFVAAVRLQPEFGEAYAALGAALRQLGRYEEAAEVHYAALTKLPKDIENMRGWARSMLALNRLGDTTATYDRLRESFPKGAAVLLEEMKAWLAAHRATPGDLRPEDVERLAQWIAEREGKAE